MSGSTDYNPPLADRAGTNNPEITEGEQAPPPIFGDPTQEASTNFSDQSNSAFMEDAHEAPPSTDGLYEPGLPVENELLNDPLTTFETEGSISHNDNARDGFNDLGDGVIPPELAELERQYSAGIGSASNLAYEEPLPDILYDEYATDTTTLGTNDTGEYVDVMPLELITAEEDARLNSYPSGLYQEPLPDNP